MTLQRAGPGLNGLGCFCPVPVPFWPGFKMYCPCPAHWAQIFLKALYFRAWDRPGRAFYHTQRVPLTGLGVGPTLTKFKPSPHWAKFGLCLIAYDMWFGFYFIFIFIFIGAKFKYALLGPKNRSGLPDMLTWMNIKYCKWHGRWPRFRNTTWMKDWS